MQQRMKVETVNNPAELAKLNEHLHILHVSQREDIFRPFDLAAVNNYFEECLSNERYTPPSAVWE